MECLKDLMDLTKILADANKISESYLISELSIKCSFFLFFSGNKNKNSSYEKNKKLFEDLKMEI